MTTRDIGTEVDDAADTVRANPAYTDGTVAEALEFIEGVIANLTADRDALRHDLNRKGD